MTYENAKLDQIIPHAISTPISSGVWAWLFWLRYWLVNCCGGRAAEQGVMPRRAQVAGRARRHSRAYFARCVLPPARDLGSLRALLPRRLSPTQSLECLARISVFGARTDLSDTRMGQRIAAPRYVGLL